MKSLGDDSMPIDVTHDEGMKKSMERSQDYSNQVSILISFVFEKKLINTLYTFEVINFSLFLIEAS